jgi:ribosome-associated protein
MLIINPSLNINERELHFDFIRSAGPGGQNVNKVATTVQLRFDINSSSLPEEFKKRLIHLAARRMTANNILVIEAKRFRTQKQNREDAVRRFIILARKAAKKPKTRRKTHPSTVSRERRLESKKKRGEIKKSRQQMLVD